MRTQVNQIWNLMSLTTGECQPRGPCASSDDVQPAGSECSVLIYHSHNSHSLFNYSVYIWPWDIASRLWALKWFHCANIATVHSVNRSGTEFGITTLAISSVMVILYNVQESLLLNDLPSSYWVNKQHVASHESLPSSSACLEEVNQEDLFYPLLIQ